MKLGKALATGVAEERPLVREEIVREEGVHEEATLLPEEAARVEPAERARAEVPAAR